MTQNATGATITARPSASPPLIECSRLGIAMSGLLAQWLRGLTINAHERLALAHLWEHGPMTMSELGARIPLSRAAVTALTDRLEALQYVRRTPDAHDRRRTVLSLTDRPAQLVAPIAESFLSELDDMAGSFSDAELAVVARFTSTLHELATRHATTLRQRADAELPSGEL